MPEGDVARHISASPWPKSGYAWYVVIILSFCYLVSFVDRQILNLLVPLIQEDLGISDTQISLLQGLSFAVFYSFLGIPIGMAVDKGPRVPIILAGIAVWSVMTAVCGLTKTYWHLFAARVGVGVGEATLSPAAYSIIADYIPPRKRALAMSIYFMGATVGISMAMLGGAAAIGWAEGLGDVQIWLVGVLKPWQITFVLAALPGLLAFGLMLSIREPARRMSGIGKPAGSHLTDRAISLGEIKDYLLENRRVYIAIFGGFTLFSLISFGFLAWIPTYMVRVHGLAPSETGWVVGLIYLIGGIGGTLFGGWLSDWMYSRGKKDAPLRVAILAAAGVSLLAPVATLTPALELSVILLAGSVFFLLMPLGLAAVALQAVTPNRMRGQVSALYLFFVTMGAMGLGPTSVALLTDFFFQDPSAVGKSLSTVAIAATPLALIMLASGLSRYRQLIVDDDS
ncbi:MFS transporter [Kineobactrum salinum]|uniref:MFS transporter n=1 Tax=Kineobactrum salinum TaxID=2708301 RepID=A0A6C0U458_9GAMM|nr:MFS transporter [Kineobactrum salinum]QIB65777.1 MFS transporter [Kineobactrum salinum]